MSSGIVTCLQGPRRRSQYVAPKGNVLAVYTLGPTGRGNHKVGALMSGTFAAEAYCEEILPATKGYSALDHLFPTSQTCLNQTSHEE
jgi:hypothetical protein